MRARTNILVERVHTYCEGTWMEAFALHLNGVCRRVYIGCMDAIAV